MTEQWWHKNKEEVCSAITAACGKIQTDQSNTYSLFFQLAYFYDPYDYLAGVTLPQEYEAAIVDNICRSNVDTVTSMVARIKHRSVFMTDEGGYKIKRQATDLGRYAEGLAKLKKIRLHERGPRIFKDSAIFGTGVLRFEIDRDGCLDCDRFLPVEVRVNEEESQTRDPRSIHLIKYRDREEMMSRFPDFASELENAPKGFVFEEFQGRWGTTDDILVRESYRLPVGKRGSKHYRPGRKVISTDNLVLVDEEYHFDRFPIAVLRWNERTTGFFGGGLVETQIGAQQTLNKYNAAIDTQIDFHASPISYYDSRDGDVVSKMQITSVGRFIPYTHQRPEVVVPTVIAPEVLVRIRDIKQGMRDDSGISTMHSHGDIPKRMDSKAAIQELAETTSERFSIQEQAYERWFLDCIEVMLMLVKGNAEAGYDTPVMGYSFRTLNKRIKWKDVKMEDVTYQIQAAPILSRTLAGRMQTINDWASAGWITSEEARHLTNHPDLASTLSLYDSILEYNDRTIEMLLEGHYTSPDPREKLELTLPRTVMAYFNAIVDGYPEQRLEYIRTWCDQAVFILSKKMMAAAPPEAGAPAPALLPN